jgi:uncharacterized membrane protein HdeD (DUF308 family)
MEVLARNWWALALRGLFAVLFGLAVFIWPGLTLLALVALFAAYALVDGVFSLVAAVRAAGRQARWWPLLLEGVLGIAAGVVTFLWPNITALALLYLIAAWAIVTGVFEIVAAVRLRREIEGELLLGLAGLASVIFGILLILFPGAGALAVLWLIGAYAIGFGILLIFLGFRLRGMRDRSEQAAA